MIKGKCLVIGAGGFVGAELSKQLTEEGYQVRALLRRKETALNLHKVSAEIFVGNILDKAAVSEAVSGMDYVFHTASLYESTPFYDISPKRIYEVNISGAKNVCDACLNADVKRLIYTGSAGSVGVRDDGMPADETVALNKLKQRSHYEKSKALAEEVVLSYSSRNLNVISINPSFLVGPGDIRPSPTGEVVLKFLNGVYPCYFDAILNLSSLSSTVRAHLTAMQNGASGSKFLVVSDVLTVDDFFSLLERVSGIKKPIMKLPINILTCVSLLNELLIGVLGLRGRVNPIIPFELLKYFRLNAKYDSKKATQELGFIPSSIEAELKKSVHWFVRYGDVKKSVKKRYYSHIGKL